VSSAAAGAAVVDEHAEVGNRPAATDGAGSYWDRPTATTLRKLLQAGGGQQGPHHRIRQGWWLSVDFAPPCLL
jgi:hypothetical protein